MEPDIDEICRFCLAEEDIVFYYIFDDRNTVNQIWQCLNLKVYVGDGLPSNICHNCLLSLRKLSHFRSKCQISNAHLVKLYKKNSQVGDGPANANVPQDDGIGTIVTDSVRSLEDDTAFDSDVDVISSHSEDNIIDLIDSENEEAFERRSEDDIFYTLPLQNYDRLQTSSGQGKSLFRVEVNGISVGPNPPNNTERPDIHLVKQIPVSYIGNLTNQPGIRNVDGNMIKSPPSVIFKFPNVTAEAQASNLQQNVPSKAESRRTPGPSTSQRLTFRTGTDLNESLSQRDETECDCKVCGKRISKKNLQQHLRRHTTQESSIPCTHCDRRFDNTKLMEQHLQVHFEGGKPFKCSQCYKKFSYSWQMSRHENVHSDKAKFVCTICERKFTSEVYLAKHVKIHSKDHVCGVCDRSFAYEHYLQKHMLQHGEPETDPESDAEDPDSALGQEPIDVVYLSGDDDQSDRLSVVSYVHNEKDSKILNGGLQMNGGARASIDSPSEVLIKATTSTSQQSFDSSRASTSRHSEVVINATPSTSRRSFESSRASTSRHSEVVMIATPSTSRHSFESSRASANSHSGVLANNVSPSTSKRFCSQDKSHAHNAVNGTVKNPVPTCSTNARKPRIELGEMRETRRKPHRDNKKMNIGESVFPCNRLVGNSICLRMFTNIDGLMTHEESDHGMQKIYSCINCMKMFTQQSYLISHCNDCKGSK